MSSRNASFTVITSCLALSLVSSCGDDRSQSIAQNDSPTTVISEATTTAVLNCYDEIPTVYNDPREEYYRSKIDEFNKSPVRRGSVILLGDSLLARLPAEFFNEQQNVVNFGIEGDETSGVLNRFDQVIAMAPSQVFILIGTNDIARNRDVAAIKNNIDLILERANSLDSSEFYFVSILPRGAELDPMVDELNEYISIKTAQSSVNFIDSYDDFTIDGMQINAELTSDGVHLNLAGSRELSNDIKSNFRLANNERNYADDRTMSVKERISRMCAGV
ncbi:GDSL-type esterase/lipase family protein [Ponticaulis profundi]|uniref:GDSL-type esterase/lipase family protein n=1 Tax=Ponticaulis profundi TaxID=2665222 RepID=A0ABW1SEH6_9PROT